jgi:hypothetical protein
MKSKTHYALLGAIALSCLSLIGYADGGKLIAEKAPASSHEDCKAYIQEAYRLLRELNAYDVHKGLQVEYLQTSKIRQKVEGNQQIDDHITIMAKHNKVVWKGKDLEVYKDGEYQVSIFKDQKTIYITDIKDNPHQKLQLEGFGGIQDSLVAKSKILSCHLDEDKQQRVVTIQPDAPFRKRLKLDSITFILDATTSQLKNLQIRYGEGHDLEMLTLEISGMALSIEEVPFSGLAIHKVFDARGMIHHKYKGFQLVDVRKDK